MTLRLAVLLLLGLALAPRAEAQTQFVQDTNCDPGTAVSNGGLTLTATNTTQGNCFANNPKYSGLWYFTFDVSSVGWTTGVGVSNSGWNTDNSTNADPIGQSSYNSAGYLLTNAGFGVYVGQFGPNQQSVTPSISYTPGATGAVVVNMNTNPRQIWITPDITGTGGCGGGPEWNGSVTSAPVAYASGANSPCGGPGTPGTPASYFAQTFGPGDVGETGMQFFVVAAYPAWTGQDYNFQQAIVTFNFADNATLDALIGSGSEHSPTYLPWNASGGAASIPGPNNPQVRNIANAPPWQQNTAYTSFPNDDRVLAGPGYNPATGLYTSGQPIYLWAVASSGGGTSGANSTYAGNFGSSPCPSPANVGGTVAPGGYTSSGTAAWNAATHVTDGSVTWVCLTPVDYTTYTAANADDVVHWAASTPFFAFQFVLTSNGNGYYLDGRYSPGLTPPSSYTCTSGSTEPTGTVYGADNSDGNCLWIFTGNVGYSSEANIFPHLLANSVFPPASATLGQVPQYNYESITQVWWGGDARPQYVDNANGEISMIYRR